MAANTSDDNTNISIAPNPSTGNTIFITRQPLYNTTLTVLNIIGKVMQIGTYEKINQSIELPAITTPGIYFLKVENENIKKTLRFVVH
ncbi:MAG: T9SS C-terminal target domain-containing protein [Chitinophagia bacterium]|nr:T9SS C-terminal target domain-containing protein [Chitinophagia bacterium]